MPAPPAEPSFEGFPPETFGWFAGLAADNSRRYFEAQRPTYERSVRGALEAMLEQLADELGGPVKLFRQHRDVRFSADKSPYKTTTYGVILGRLDSLAALYAQLSAVGLFAGTGSYTLAADQLGRFRAAVADGRSGPALERALGDVRSAGLEIFGEALKTAPRGYPRDHPRVGLLRHRSLVAGRRLDPGPAGIAPAAALDHSRGSWAACAALNAWLDEHVGERAARRGARRTGRPPPALTPAGRHASRSVSAGGRAARPLEQRTSPGSLDARPHRKRPPERGARKPVRVAGARGDPCRIPTPMLAADSSPARLSASPSDSSSQDHSLSAAPVRSSSSSALEWWRAASS